MGDEDLTELITRNVCPLCKEHHPADEGIVLYVREFVCSDCGAEWSDLWCADCNDRCPNCDAENEPEPGRGRSTVFEKPMD